MNYEQGFSDEEMAKGIAFDYQRKKWQVVLWVNGRAKRVGRYESIFGAFQAKRDLAAGRIDLRPNAKPLKLSGIDTVMLSWRKEQTEVVCV
jgi:hypothetical protein